MLARVRTTLGQIKVAFSSYSLGFLKNQWQLAIALYDGKKTAQNKDGSKVEICNLKYWGLLQISF